MIILLWKYVGAFLQGASARSTALFSEVEGLFSSLAALLIALPSIQLARRAGSEDASASVGQSSMELPIRRIFPSSNRQSTAYALSRASREIGGRYIPKYLPSYRNESYVIRMTLKLQGSE
jgi:hypothetical protein